nr:transglycosylase domain-containing protein [Lachnospiraceae bacterium]
MSSVKRIIAGVVNCFRVIIKTILSYIGVFSGVITAVLGIFAAVLLAAGIAGLVVYVKVLPDFTEAREVVFDKLVNMSKNDFISNEDTIIYDYKGEKLATVNAGHYKYVSISKVSPYLYNGYIAVEDKRFKTHAGVDLLATLRAGVALLKNSGGITQGGSTITQQVIKNNLLSQEQTYSRKMAEIMLAPSVEAKFSKDQIMEFYCNSNYYGNRCYGVSSASKYYFGKKPIDLLPEEAAMLIALSNNPTAYNPVENYDDGLERRNYVLEKMYVEGVISRKEYKRAVKTDIEVLQLTGKVTNENYETSYAIYCASIELMEQENFVFQYTFDTKEEYEDYNEEYSAMYSEMSDKIRSGGYKIYTTINPKKQAKLQAALDNGLVNNLEKASDGRYALQGAAVCVDNSNQYVVAIVGGRGTKDSYNRAFLSARQSGSSIKPLIDYGPGLESGMFSPSTYVDDHEIKDGPKNSGGGYAGRIQLREAVARSLNTIAWQVLQAITPEYGLSFLSAMHFHNLSYVDNGNLALSLGGFTNGVRVVDMAKGYSTLANNGAFSERSCITKLEHVTDGVLYLDGEGEDTTTQVYSKDAAWMMTDILKGVINESYGTGASLKLNNGQIAAGKTGTTDSGKDLWFCGYTAYYTTVVWVGYDTPRAMNAYGATIPGVIWKNYMNDIHSSLQPLDFVKPETVCLARYDSNGNIIEGTEVTGDVKRSYGYDYFSTTILEDSTDYVSKLEEEELIKS